MHKQTELCQDELIEEEVRFTGAATSFSSEGGCLQLFLVFGGTGFEHLMSSQSEWIQCPLLENGLVIAGKCLVFMLQYTEAIVDSIGSGIGPPEQTRF